MAELSEQGRVLIVATEPVLRQRIAERVALERYRPTLEDRVQGAAGELLARAFSVAVVADPSAPLLEQLRRLDPTLACLVVSENEPTEESGPTTVSLDPPEPFWRALREAADGTARTRRLLGPPGLGAFAEALPDAVWAIDTGHRYLFVSPAAEQLLGAPARDLVGRSILEQQPRGDTSWWASAFAVVLGEGCPFSRFEREIETPDGRRRVIETSATPRFDERGELIGYLGIDRDVTDRVSAQREHARREARRREEWLQARTARLSGELAHDLNNVLTAILGYVEMSRAEAEEGAPLAAVDRIEAVAARAVELGRSLALISGAGSESMELVDLRRVVRECVASQEPARLDAEGGEGDPIWVRGVAGRLSRALDEVVTNALEASPRDRLVRIVIEPTRLGHRAGARIVIEDEGPGLPPSPRDPFAPFATSKPRGVGTGLGLTVARSVIERHQGTIALEPREPCGTRCVVELPEARDAAGERGSATQPTVVLVAEDHDHVRQLVTEALSAAGFTSLPAADGDEAARLVERHADRIRFAIVDLDLPGRSGLSLLQACRRRKPGLPALIMTGRSEPFAREEVPPDVVVLRKPFVLTELIDTVRSAWGGEREAAAFEAEA